MSQKAEKTPREYRGVVDEIREQQKKMKDMTFKEKLAYFWYYYKVHTIVILLVVIFGGYWIYEIATTKDMCFYGIMLNASQLDGDVMETSFSEYADLDTETYECFIDSMSTLSYQTQTEYDMATYQKIVALVQTKDLDVMVLDGQVFYNFSFNGMLLDLRTVMTEEELAAHEGNIYYIDYAAIKEAEAHQDSATTDELMKEAEKRNQATAEEITAEANSHRDPSTMKEPIPVGIFLTDSPFVEKTNAYNALIPIYGICATTQRQDTALKYLDYLFDESIPFEAAIEVWM